MRLFPKPRGFWDYSIFALAMSGFLLLWFWGDAHDRLRWADGLLAATGAVLFVLGVILVRRGEKAKWIAHPTWRVYLGWTVGVSVWLFGTVYADAYLLHRESISSNRLWHDVAAVAFSAAITFSVLRNRGTGTRHQSS